MPRGHSDTRTFDHSATVAGGPIHGTTVCHPNGLGFGVEQVHDAIISIRAANGGDADVIIGFNRAMAVETEQVRLDESASDKGVRIALSDPKGCRYFLAEVNREIAGQTMLTTEWSDWRNGWFWWIQSVYVLPAFRQIGVFRALYNHVRDLARREPDVRGLRLYVDRDNERAMRTYEKLGMTRTRYLLFEEEL